MWQLLVCKYIKWYGTTFNIISEQLLWCTRNNCFCFHKRSYFFIHLPQIYTPSTQ